MEPYDELWGGIPTKASVGVYTAEYDKDYRLVVIFEPGFEVPGQFGGGYLTWRGTKTVLLKGIYKPAFTYGDEGCMMAHAKLHKGEVKDCLARIIQALPEQKPKSEPMAEPPNRKGWIIAYNFMKGNDYPQIWAPGALDPSASYRGYLLHVRGGVSFIPNRWRYVAPFGNAIPRLNVGTMRLEMLVSMDNFMEGGLAPTGSYQSTGWYIRNFEEESLVCLDLIIHLSACGVLAEAIAEKKYDRLLKLARLSAGTDMRGERDTAQIMARRILGGLRNEPISKS